MGSENVMRLWMLYIDNSNKSILNERGGPVIFEPGWRIVDLIKEIEKNLKSLGAIDEHEIEIWKIKKEITHIHRVVNRENSTTEEYTADKEWSTVIQEYIRSLDFSNHSQDLQLLSHEDLVLDTFEQNSGLDHHFRAIARVATHKDHNEGKRSFSEVEGSSVTEDVERAPPTKRAKTPTNIQRRDEYLADKRSATFYASPSTMSGKHALYGAILGGVPMFQYGHPPALYHPALAALQIQLENFDFTQRHQINPSNKSLFEHARDYCESALRLGGGFSTWEHTKDFFSCLLGSENYHEACDPDEVKSQSINFRPGFVWGDPAYVIVRANGYPCLSGGASLDAVRAYIAACDNSKDDSHFKFSSVFPAILIGIDENIFEVSTVVTLEEVHFQKIFRFELRGSDNTMLMLSNIVRIGNIIKIYAEELKKEYDELRSATVADPDLMEPNWHLPRPTLLAQTGGGNGPSPDDQILSRLRFKCPLDYNGHNLELTEAPSASCLFLADMYPAHCESGGCGEAVQVVVKFVSNYYQEAHELLASHDPPLAPRLYGIYPIVGIPDMRMIVMGQAVGATMDELTSTKKEGKSDNDEKNPKLLSLGVYEDVKKAIGLLHEHDIVFGDLRTANIVVADNDANSNHQGQRAMLVDFDFAGRHGMDTYDPFINECLVSTDSEIKEWHKDVCSLGFMLKEHDDWALEHVIRGKCRDKV